MINRHRRERRCQGDNHDRSSKTLEKYIKGTIIIDRHRVEKDTNETSMKDCQRS